MLDDFVTLAGVDLQLVRAALEATRFGTAAVRFEQAADALRNASRIASRVASAVGSDLTQRRVTDDPSSGQNRPDGVPPESDRNPERQ
jgi:hypothetical protein